MLKKANLHSLKQSPKRQHELAPTTHTYTLSDSIAAKASQLYCFQSMQNAAACLVTYSAIRPHLASSMLAALASSAVKNQVQGGYPGPPGVV